MRALIGVSQLIKEVYCIVLKPSDVHTKYHTISKIFGTILQFIVHEDNSTCLKFATVPKTYPQTKHIAIPYQLFHTKIEHLEIKVATVSTDNQLANNFTK